MRARYDKYGPKGLEEGFQPPFDIFEQFFQKEPAKRKGLDIHQTIEVSLQDLYEGRNFLQEIIRHELDGRTRPCEKCNGKGVLLETHRQFVGIVLRKDVPCGECKGRGFLGKTEEQRVRREVVVAPGTMDGQRITVKGLGDAHPDGVPGDVHFTIKQSEHHHFKRKGDDLMITKKLSLKEALTGFAWKFNHLDSREIFIQSQPGEIIKPAARDGAPFVKLVRNEGMPRNRRPYEKGSLYVKFIVNFPEDGALSPDFVAVLAKLLPGPAPERPCPPLSGNAIVHLEQATISEFGRGTNKQSGEAKTEDASDSHSSTAFSWWFR